MELTAAALWLNTTFSGFDGLFLRLWHSAAEHLGVVLTPLMKLITLLGEKGLLMFLLAFVFMCFANTRRSGVCIFGAVCCGALITNIILKDAVARPRPFETVELYRSFWLAVGSPVEDGFSFPSGHVTALSAGMLALSLTKGKKYLIPSGVAVLFMCISRNYLMAHYPSDVLVAAMVGTVSAFASYGVTCLIYRFLDAYEDYPLVEFILYENLSVPSAASLRKAGYKGKHEK